MNKTANYFNVLGVGFGPANLALAAAMEEMNFPYSVRFLEKQPELSSVWQKEMLIQHSDIQNHPLRDLVTPRNPRSRYSFTNYLFENNRLFEHLNLGMNFPYRIEYSNYISWVGKHFRNIVTYDSCVDQISLEPSKDNDAKFCVRDSSGKKYYSDSLVVAPGRTPNIPHEFQPFTNKHICHVSNYLACINELKRKKTNPSICVVGGSQSAVEIILHLSEYCPDAKITGTFKNFGYRQKDCSPFTGEVYFPEFVDFFYNSSLTDRRQLTKDLYYTNYSAVDSDVLDQLYRKLYLQKLTGHNNIHLHRLSKIMKVELMGDMVDIEFEKMEEPGFLKDQFDMVVLATGFKNIGSGENEELFPDLLKGISGHCQYSREDGLLIDRDYRLKFVENLPANLACYVNGLCESSHGMGDAGSLSLVALRAEVIINSLQQVLKKGGITERMPVALSA